MVLTLTGKALMERRGEIMQKLGRAVDYVGGMTVMLCGKLKISAGIGFGLNVPAE